MDGSQEVAGQPLRRLLQRSDLRPFAIGFVATPLILGVGAFLTFQWAWEAGGYTLYYDFAAIQTSTVVSAWPLALPAPFNSITAFPAKGSATQSSTVWGTLEMSVDTIGVSGDTACFSGIYDYRSGQMRYTACVVDGGQPGAGNDQWFSRWDMYGPGMGTFPIVSGNLQVH
jgi:hypothetical protein